MDAKLEILDVLHIIARNSTNQLWMHVLSMASHKIVEKTSQPKACIIHAKPPSLRNQLIDHKPIAKRLNKNEKQTGGTISCKNGALYGHRNMHPWLMLAIRLLQPMANKLHRNKR